MARQVISLKPNICAQVLVEVANVCKNQFRFTKHNLLILWENLLNDCTLIPTDHQSIQKAIQLTERYDFQLFDALIIADALRADCTILYSEDMQHNMFVEKQMTIINPFL